MRVREQDVTINCLEVFVPFVVDKKHAMIALKTRKKVVITFNSVLLLYFNRKDMIFEGYEP